MSDYSEELVLNLDNDENTNFVVFDEKTVRADDGTGVNQVHDNGDGTYTVENADESFLSLKQGDTFSYEKVMGN